MKTLCLSMMVKNEEKIISRSLENAKTFIDYWVIVDTGSSDKTKEIVKKELENIPGELIERPWKSFGENRTELLELSKGKADYVLLLDADMTVTVHDKNFKNHLDRPSYTFYYDTHDEIQHVDAKLIIDNKLEWTYLGEIHEVIFCKSKEVGEHFGLNANNYFDKLTINHHRDGNWRSSVGLGDGGNIKLLTEALEKERQPYMRATYFYMLGQEHFYQKKYQKAVYWFEERLAYDLKHETELTEIIRTLSEGGKVEFGVDIGVLEEDKPAELMNRLLIELEDCKEMIYISRNFVATALYHQQSLSEENAVENFPLKKFLEAHNCRPHRLEATYSIIQYFRLSNMNHLAYEFAKKSSETTPPLRNSAMFVDYSLYDYKIDYELMLASINLIKFEEAKRALSKLINSNHYKNSEKFKKEINKFKDVLEKY